MSKCLVTLLLQGVMQCTKGVHCRTAPIRMVVVVFLLLNLASPFLCQTSTNGPADDGHLGQSQDETSAPSDASTGVSQAPIRTCRDRLGPHPPDQFNKFACGMCFRYLYHVGVKRVFFNPRFLAMIVLNATGSPITAVSPDLQNSSAVETVCAEVRRAGEDCQRWKDCCRAAQACCERQLAQESTLPGPDHFVSNGTSDAGEEGGSGFCPRTWDGYSCWDDTESGSNVIKYCPTYVAHSSPDGTATKRCMDNGTWFISPMSGQEWTDYTQCVVLTTYTALFWVGLVCNVISLILLLPACIIFLHFRSLRTQHRIKLHVCLFASYILTNALMILWEVIIVHDRLSNHHDDTVLHKNSVGCRILHVLTRYAWTTNFLWMWLEGFHLYRLMVHAFRVPRSLVGFYVGGYTAPLVPVLIYSTIRIEKEELDLKCWVPNAGHFEWIIYIPILFCLAGNLFFLGRIMYVMLRQLHSHPNEPSNYRRAVKAAGILIPLFGLQAILVMGKPPQQIFAWEIIAKIVTNTQGATVALGFCYFNGEVLTVLRNALPRSMRSRSLLRSDQRSTMSTQFTTDAGSRSHSHFNSTAATTASRVSMGANGTGYASNRDHNAAYIPLSTMGDDIYVRGLKNNKEDGIRNGLA